MVNVHDYGAVGDGIADDSSAVMAACAADTTIEFKSDHKYRFKQTVYTLTGRALFGHGALIIIDGSFGTPYPFDGYDMLVDGFVFVNVNSKRFDPLTNNLKPPR